MDKAAYGEVLAQSDWHEKALYALMRREDHRRATRDSFFAAYWGVAATGASFAGIVGWVGDGVAKGAMAVMLGLCMGSLLAVLVRMKAPPPIPTIVEDEFGLAVRIYLARKLQGAVHGTGVEGNLADAERDRRRLGLPDVPMGVA